MATISQYTSHCSHHGRVNLLWLLYRNIQHTIVTMDVPIYYGYYIAINNTQQSPWSCQSTVATLSQYTTHDSHHGRANLLWLLYRNIQHTTVTMDVPIYDGYSITIYIIWQSPWMCQSTMAILSQYTSHDSHHGCVNLPWLLYHNIQHTAVTMDMSIYHGYSITIYITRQSPWTCQSTVATLSQYTSCCIHHGRVNLQWLLHHNIHHTTVTMDVSIYHGYSIIIYNTRQSPWMCQSTMATLSQYTSHHSNHGHVNLPWLLYHNIHHTTVTMDVSIYHGYSITIYNTRQSPWMCQSTMATLWQYTSHHSHHGCVNLPWLLYHNIHHVAYTMYVSIYCGYSITEHYSQSPWTSGISHRPIIIYI